VGGSAAVDLGWACTSPLPAAALTSSQAVEGLMEQALRLPVSTPREASKLLLAVGRALRVMGDKMQCTPAESIAVSHPLVTLPTSPQQAHPGIPHDPPNYSHGSHHRRTRWLPAWRLCCYRRWNSCCACSRTPQMPRP
jgi:hypothetical protein